MLSAMRFTHHLVLATALCSSAFGQSAAEFKKNRAATEELKQLIENAYFTSVTIEARSSRQAIQQLCDLIGSKQSIENEAKVLFRVETAPTSGKSSKVQAELISGSDLLKKVCAAHNLKATVDLGKVIITSDTASESYKSAINNLKNITVAETNITAEYFPVAVRKLLKPHDLSFSLITKINKSTDGKILPTQITPLRISSYKKSNSDLYTVLAEVANSVNLQLSVNTKGILFAPKNANLVTEIIPTRLRK